MLKKMAICNLLAIWILLSFATVPLFGQGVSAQDYTGLDKYLGEGIPQGFSFVGARAAEFLTIPVGARGIGMGGAFSAVCDDISSIWWNPAGLGFLQNSEVMLTVVDYTMNLTYSYAACAVPVMDGRLVVGGFFGYLDIPQMEITTVENPNGTGNNFEAYDFQMGGSLAYNLSDRFTAGLNLKYVHQDVFSNISGSAFAMDAGGIYHTEFMDRGIKIAFAIQNLGTNITMQGPNLIYEVGPEDRGGILPTGYENYGSNVYAVSKRGTRQVKYLTHAYRLPTIVKLGLSYNLFTSDKTNWLVSGELWRNSNMPTSYTAGTEVIYNVSPYLNAGLRFGWHIQKDEFTTGSDDFGYDYLGDDPTLRGISFGGGIKRTFGSKFIEFNYAYQNKGRLSADNFFTFKFGF
ncbi:MAG TPA: PorV/PorQ family protein [archaeon]|nr:PorV/PorQ family protein [archaeon]